MKITVNTFGTRGDIQPYVALGQGLLNSGHQVRIVTHRIFESFVKEYEFDFYPLEIDPRQVLINQALSDLGNNTIRIMRWMEEHFKGALEEIFKVTLDANSDADLILNSALSFAGWHVAELLEKPSLAAYLWPANPSRYLPAATRKAPPEWLPFKGSINFLSTKLSNQLFFNLLLPNVNQCRKDILNLSPMTRREYWSLDSARSSTKFVYGFSPVVIQKPPDWTNNQQISGYWFLDSKEEYQPDPALLKFLANGTAPVYVGFGSMVDHEKEEIYRIVLEALVQTKQRAILLGGWSDLGGEEVPDFIYRIDNVPHDWLFPRMAVLVHHGGAGTTAAGLRAGVANIIVPWFGDQFFWGDRVFNLGAGPKPIPRLKLTSEKLASAIQSVLDNQEMNQKAAEIGTQIRSEDGVGTAVKLIETFMESGHF